jgi:hypothetical protein
VEVAIVVAVITVAFGVVVYPLIRRSPGELAQLSEEALDEQVARYREAIRRGTLCDRCLTANPPGSRFCSDCGKLL